MSKNRRDSSACELEERLREVKNANCRFRKILMEKENELQGLVRKLGPEARKWIDGMTCTGTISGANSEMVRNLDTEPILNTGSGKISVSGGDGMSDIARLSVPNDRKDMPSTTGERFI